MGTGQWQAMGACGWWACGLDGRRAGAGTCTRELKAAAGPLDWGGCIAWGHTIERRARRSLAPCNLLPCERGAELHPGSAPLPQTPSRILRVRLADWRPPPTQAQREAYPTGQAPSRRRAEPLPDSAQVMSELASYLAGQTQDPPWRLLRATRAPAVAGKDIDLRDLYFMVRWCSLPPPLAR
jgi:hypothetical protein